ncbi:MAG: methionyl-tRNA formyltransferase [Phycisphaerales bacterium]|nr:methionyl-tRNA formyltransferase [Phycisphaerales bacterium]
MNVVFLGSGAFGLPTLRALAQAHSVVGIVTQPDKPAGRAMEPTATPVGAWAAEHLPQVPLLKPERINAPEAVAQVRGFPASAWVVIAYGQKLGAELLQDAFAVNLHASLLPRWRGAAPIHHAVLAGDVETGNSVIALAEKMDAGRVFAQSRRPIGAAQTTGELHDLLAEDGAPLVLGVLEEREQGRESGREQDGALATAAPKLSRADAWVDFARSADQVRRRVNGLSPWPGVSVKLGETTLKLLRAELDGAPAEQAAGAAGGSSGDANPHRRPFSSGALMDADRGVVACGDGAAVRLLEVQPSGKRAMSWAEFARGRRMEPGGTLVPDVAPPSAPPALP